MLVRCFFEAISVFSHKKNRIVYNPLTILMLYVRPKDRNITNLELRNDSFQCTEKWSE